MWNVLDTGIQTARENMAFDKKLLESMLPDDAPILHLYDWQRDSATYGYFTKPKHFLDIAKAESRGLDLARRPTGGGIVFHTFDLAFSVLVPANHPGYSENTLENYAFVNSLVQEAILPLIPEESDLLPQDPEPLDESSRNFCMAKPTIFDVMIKSRKIGGAAQRKKKQGFLHQGTISIIPPNQELLEEILLPETRVLEAMKKNSFALLPENHTPGEFLEMRETLKQELTKIVKSL
ncbi:MAG: lipoate--protein ligase family protein [Candidatus Algichlamydia australiensis]|nr:lipoate--protein ligase family protein [Chlamydiales bacterium]